jgi:hypothetical protein
LKTPNSNLGIQGHRPTVDIGDPPRMQRSLSSDGAAAMVGQVVIGQIRITATINATVTDVIVSEATRPKRGLDEFGVSSESGIVVRNLGYSVPLSNHTLRNGDVRLPVSIPSRIWCPDPTEEAMLDYIPDKWRRGAIRRCKVAPSWQHCACGFRWHDRNCPTAR